MRARAAVVLPIVLLLLLVIELLTVGTLTLAWSQHGLARERVQALRAQSAARDGSLTALAAWPQAEHQTLPPSTRTTLFAGGVSAHTNVTTTLERLTPSLFLLRAIAAVGPDSARAARSTAGLLVAVTDLTAILPQFEGALTVGGPLTLTGGSVLSALNPSALPSGWPAPQCSSWLPSAPVKPGVVTPDVTSVSASTSALIDGQPAALERPSLSSETFDQLGTLDPAALRTRADRVESGALVLAPLANLGACQLSATGNWGAPLDPAHPCSDYFPLIFAPGDLTIVRGAGQGVLVVNGDLTLDANTQFYGVVLVSGRLIVNAGAAVVGAVRSRTAALLGGTIARCDCALTRALTRAPALNRPVSRSVRSWVPGF